MSSRISFRLRILLWTSIISVLLSGSAFCAEMALGWDPPDDTRVTGYHVYYGLSGTEYKNIPKLTIGSRTQASTGISSLEQGKTYQFVMTSFDAEGNESIFSEEIAYTVPVDADNDGVPDADDLCPDDPEKTAPGDCGCGVADTDSDGDGIPDCNDTGDGGGSEPPAGGGDDGSDPPVSGENAPPDAPFLISPPDAAFDLDKQITFEAGGFFDPDNDAHKATEWQIATDAGFSNLVLSRTEVKKLTKLSVTHVLFAENTVYYWRARYFDALDASSPWSDTFSFTTADWGRDRNKNGIADANELIAPVDLDSDGVSDNEQADILSLQVVNSDKQVGIKPIDGGVEYIESIDPLLIDDQLKKPESLPYGMVDFRMQVDAPGQTVTVTVHLCEAAPENARWYKYDDVAGWQDYSEFAEFSPNRKSVEITLTDGGSGDADGVANGIIIDPSGIGINAVDPDGDGGLKENTGSGGGGGGGCFIRSLLK